MWYQFRHVLMGQMTCASELKPYFHNNEDPWKKIWHFKYWNWLCCNQNSQILAKKSISQYGYLKHSKWAVLRNLSLIPIIMRIGEKKLGCLNTKNLWLASMLLFFRCVFCSKIFWYYDTPIFSPILVIYSIRLKFLSTAHLECFKYPYWYLLFLAKIRLFWFQQGQFQCLKCHFFSRILIIIKIRLKFQSTGHLAL